MWHLQYNDWQEQGLPRNVSSYLQFLEELSELRRLTVRIPDVKPGLGIRIRTQQCFGSAYIIMRIRIQVRIKLKLDPNPIRV